MFAWRSSLVSVSSPQEHWWFLPKHERHVYNVAFALSWKHPWGRKSVFCMLLGLELQKLDLCVKMWTIMGPSSMSLHKQIWTVATRHFLRRRIFYWQLSKASIVCKHYAHLSSPVLSPMWRLNCWAEEMGCVPEWASTYLSNQIRHRGSHKPSPTHFQELKRYGPHYPQLAKNPHASAGTLSHLIPC